MTKRLTIKMPKLYPKQRDALFRRERIGKIDGSTKSGKTVGALCWQLDQGITHRPGMTHAWTAMTHPQSKTAYRRMRRILARVDQLRGMWDGNDSEQRIILWNGSTFVYRGSENLDALYSGDAGSVIVDEDSRCKEGTLDAMLSITTATGGPIRCIGNVKGRGNWAYQLGAKIRSGQIADAYYAKLTCLDAVEAGVLSQSVVDDARSMLPDAAFRELYLCEPADDGGNPFGVASIEACYTEGKAGEPIAFGIDVARSVDWFVVTGLDSSGRVAVFERWQKATWEHSVARALSIIGDKPTLIDSTGVGDPIHERLARVNRRVEPYPFSSKSKQALMEGLAVAIQKREIQFSQPEIKDELMVFEYEATRTGVRYSAPAGLHDDCVMSLALARTKWNQLTNGPGVYIGFNNDIPKREPEIVLDFNELRKDPDWGFDAA